MRKEVLLVSVVALAIASLASPVGAKEKSKAGDNAVSDQKITINTGATNPGKTIIEIASDDTTTVNPARGGEKYKLKLSADVLKKLREDISKAEPLKDLPGSREIKSASFGVHTFVSQGDQRSPDIESENPGDHRVKALLADIKSIMDEVAKQHPQN